MALSGLAKLQITRTLLFLLCVFDAAASTLLFIRIADGNAKDNIHAQVYQFNFGVSSFDIWLLALLRSSVFCGLVVAFCCNKVVALRRVKTLSPAFAVLLIVITCYTVAKLLTSFEFYNDGTAVHGPDLTTNSSNTSVDSPSLANASLGSQSQGKSRRIFHPWLWSMIAWTALSEVLYGILYFSLASLRLTYSLVETPKSRVVHIQSDESTPLIQNDSMPESGKAAEVEEDTKKEMSSLTVMRKLVGYCKPDAHLYIVGFTFLMISSSAMAFIPYYTGQVINHIAIAPSTSDFTRAILVMSLITVVSAVSAGLRGSILVVANARLNVRLRNKLFCSLVHQEIAFFDQSSTGDLTSRLTADTTQMSDQIGLNLNIFLRNLVTSIGSIVFMVQLSWKLSTLTLVVIPIIAVITWYFGEHFKKLQKQIQDSFAKANSVAEESLSSMKTVRSFANEDTEAEHYTAKLNLTLRIFFKKAYVYGSWMWSNNLLELLLQVVTLYYGGHLVIYQEMSGGELVSFLLYQVSLGAAIDSMGSVVAGLMQAVGAAEKVFELIERSPEIDHKSGKDKPEKLAGVVEFRNVCFSYPTRPDVPVLKEVSFTAQPGEVVALVGPSGGGKSSCISLLERFYEPEKGEVLLDGQPLSLYDHSYLHTKMSLVGQEPVLYAGSIAENIAYGMKGVSQETIQHVAALANAHNFITGMIDGYETQTGEKGTQLSGGQKQRVAIARALIRKPSILLLDEATSALDAESEHLVQQALNKSLHGRTVIVIAHRLSTIENADKIVVVNKGEIMEVGTHQELLRRGGMYTKLVRKQMLVEEKKSSLGGHLNGVQLSGDDQSSLDSLEAESCDLEILGSKKGYGATS